MLEAIPTDFVVLVERIGPETEDEGAPKEREDDLVPEEVDAIPGGPTNAEPEAEDEAPRLEPEADLEIDEDVVLDPDSPPDVDIL